MSFDLVLQDSKVAEHGHRTITEEHNHLEWGGRRDADMARAKKREQLPYNRWVRSGRQSTLPEKSSREASTPDRSRRRPQLE
jgi:hypothetical protein